MIIIMEKDAGQDEIQAVRQKAEDLGYITSLTHGMERVIISIIGTYPDYDLKEIFQAIRGVEEAIPILKPFKLSSRESKSQDTVIEVNGIKIGSSDIIVMAGPSAVERRDQLLLTAYAIKEAGAKVLRGGAYRVRVRTDEMPGLGREGLEVLKEVRQETGLMIITEVRNPLEVEIVGSYADIIQIGARFMHNYELLAAAAESRKPVLLKRGVMSSIEEWLLSAEYILKRGNPRVVLCERGIRTFEKYSQFTLDLSCIPILKKLSHLPVIVDPSHGTGRSSYVPAMAKAAVAAGADGLLIEVHPNPPAAVTGGIRHLELHAFSELMQQLKTIAKAVGRNI